MPSKCQLWIDIVSPAPPTNDTKEIMIKRVAIFLPSLDGGGAEKVMLALAERFVARGVACDIVIAITKGQLLNSVPAGVRLISLNKAKTLTATIRLAGYLRRERPDALLVTVFNATITALLAHSISFTSTRLVTCEASPTDWDVKGHNWLDTFLNRVAALALYRHADATIAVSNGVRSSLLRGHFLPPRKVHVIPNPIPFLESSSKHRKLDVDRPLVLACGRLEPQKDHATLLRAFACLRKKINARLVILGEGSLLDSLKLLSQELGIATDVAFAGFDPDPSSFMRNASVFVHTARYEGFGVVLLEALASGCPVIATDCPGGVREVLAEGKYGALLPVGDDKQLAEAMELVLRGKLRFADPAIHLQKYRLETIADAYLDLLIPKEP